MCPEHPPRVDSGVALVTARDETSEELLDLSNAHSLVLWQVIEAVMQILDLSVSGYQPTEDREELLWDALTKQIERHPVRVDVHAVARGRLMTLERLVEAHLSILAQRPTFIALAASP